MGSSSSDPKPTSFIKGKQPASSNDRFIESLPPHPSFQGVYEPPTQVEEADSRIMNLAMILESLDDQENWAAESSSSAARRPRHSTTETFKDVEREQRLIESMIFIIDSRHKHEHPTPAMLRAMSDLSETESRLRDMAERHRAAELRSARLGGVDFCVGKDGDQVERFLKNILDTAYYQKCQLRGELGAQMKRLVALGGVGVLIDWFRGIKEGDGDENCKMCAMERGKSSRDGKQTSRNPSVE